MTSLQQRGVAELQSGKGHKDENFPVASFLIAPKHRPGKILTIIEKVVSVESRIAMKLEDTAMKLIGS